MYVQQKNKLYNFDNNIKKIFEFEFMLSTYLFLVSIYFYYFLTQNFAG